MIKNINPTELKELYETKKILSVLQSAENSIKNEQKYLEFKELQQRIFDEFRIAKHNYIAKQNEKINSLHKIKDNLIERSNKTFRQINAISEEEGFGLFTSKDFNDKLKDICPALLEEFFILEDTLKKCKTKIEALSDLIEKEKINLSIDDKESIDLIQFELSKDLQDELHNMSEKDKTLLLNRLQPIKEYEKLRLFNIIMDLKHLIDASGKYTENKNDYIATMFLPYILELNGMQFKSALDYFIRQEKIEMPSPIVFYNQARIVKNIYYIVKNTLNN